MYNFHIHLSLSYQLNIDCYNYNMYYESLLIMTNQKPITDTKMIKKPKLTLQKSILKDSKRGRKELQSNKKTMNKMKIVSP